MAIVYVYTCLHPASEWYVQSSCDSGVMESASGAVAVSSSEQIELEVEGSTANDDQTSLYAEDDSHNREEGNLGMSWSISYNEILCVFSSAVDATEDDEKPPAYDSLNGVAHQELPTAKQKSNTFMGEFAVPAILIT